MSDKPQQVGRLALRVEGDWWVAYYALPDTMKDAMELARIRMGIVQDQRRKQAFMDLLRDVIGEFLEATVGARPDFVVNSAPEHERAGRECLDSWDQPDDPPPHTWGS